jgi:hypothetical protein
MNRILNAFTVAILILAVAVPVGLWFYLTRDEGPTQVPGGASQFDPSRIFNPQSDVLEALVPDTSGAVERRKVRVKDADTFAGTVTVTPKGDAPYAVIGIRRVDSGLLYEFRGKRYDRFTAHPITVDGMESEAMYVPVPLSFWETETRLGLGVGYNGSAVFYASASLLRLWGFHLGVAVGLERATADVLIGPNVQVFVYRTFSVGASYNINSRRVWATAGIIF